MKQTNRYWSILLVAALSPLGTVGCADETGTEIETTTEDVAEAHSALLSYYQKVTMVAVRFHTGGDDKRSGTQVDFQLYIRPGNTNTWSTSYETWPNDSWTGWYYGQLPTNTVYGDIWDLGVLMTEHNGFIQTDDNWNMDALEVYVQTSNGAWNYIGSPVGKRFTGSSRQWWWNHWPWP